MPRRIARLAHRLRRGGDATGGPVDFAFLADPPDTVEQLAACLRVRTADLMNEGERQFGSIVAPPLGPERRAALSEHVKLLLADFRWDMYHERSVTSVEELASRELRSYRVSFADGRAAAEAVLERAYGAPRPLVHDQNGHERHLRRYGTFFVDTGEGDAFGLEWHWREPDWAKPAVDPSARAEAMRWLCDRLAEATTVEAVTTAVVTLPDGLGISDRPAFYPREGHDIEFEPPMPADMLAAALGIASPAAQSGDVHMAMWHLVTLVDGRTARLRIGDWELEATLAGWPSGELLQDVFQCKLLDPGDTVRYLHIRRPRA